MKFCKSTFISIILVCAVLFAVAPTASADSVTYSYAGNPFDTFDFGYKCPPQCHISGSFTVANAFAANVNSMVPFIPLAFSFTDGSTTFNQGNISLGSTFDFIQTDGQGKIVGWDIFLTLNNGQSLITTTLLTPLDLTLDPTSFADAFVLGNPGSWTSATQVPEPGFLVLLALGLVAVMGTCTRKLVPQRAAR